MDARSRKNSFLSRVTKTKSCWLWLGHNNKGYGTFYFDYKNQRAHRASYEMFVGIIPRGKYVLHHCDNPPCVNPKHLYIGDARDNALDCIERGRFKYLLGDSNPHSKLTEADIPKIRQLRAKGFTLLEISKQYGVNYNTISKACSGISWNCVKFEKEAA